MRPLLIFAVWTAATMAGVHAQEELERLHPDKLRIIDEVNRKREEMRDGRIQHYNVRARVKLKNGAKLTGVVKEGRFVERLHGLDFVAADRRNPEAGIRLWYSGNTNSFVFLRYNELESHQIIAKLSDDEVKALELEMNERERQLLAQRRAGEASATTAASTGTGEAGAATEPTEPASTDTRNDEQAALLAEFPPEEGWSEERLQAIHRRKVVIGVFPNEKERRFIEVFESWKVAFAAREQAAVKQQQAAEAQEKAKEAGEEQPARPPAASPGADQKPPPPPAIGQS